MSMKTGPLSTDEVVVLTRLWHEGVATREIGRRMERTFDSVIGHAHRLGLPKRSSPIRPVAERIA